MHSTSNNNKSHAFAINKKTGEVKKYETYYTNVGTDTEFGHYNIGSN